MGYSAACFDCASSVSSAAIARSKNPGFPGCMDRKAARSIPTAAAARRNSWRFIRKSWTSSGEAKSSLATAQSHSSSVGVLTAPSRSIKDLCAVLAIVPYLTSVGFSQRNDAQSAVSDSVDAGEKPSIKVSVTRDAIFAVISPQIHHISSVRPIQSHRISQRNAMFRPVCGILSFIPLKLHDRHSIGGLVNTRLTGDLA